MTNPPGFHDFEPYEIEELGDVSTDWDISTVVKAAAISAATFVFTTAVLLGSAWAVIEWLRR